MTGNAMEDPSADDDSANVLSGVLQARLDDLIAARSVVLEALSNETEENKGLAESLAGNFVALAIDLAADFCGDQILETALRGGGDDPLLIIAQRMRLVSPLFNRSHADPVFTELGIESVAVSQGDAPRLFARRGKGRESRFRLDCFRLEALKWSKYFAGQGLPASGAKGWQARMEDAFGVDWDSIRRNWPKKCAETFSKEQVDRSLRAAFDLGRIANPTEADRWKADLRYASVEEAGAAFQREVNAGTGSN